MTIKPSFTTATVHSTAAVTDFATEQLQLTTQSPILQLQQPFNGLFSRTTWVSRYQKGKTNLDFTGARDSEWLWHHLGHMQACTSLQTDNHASTPPLFFTGPMAFLPPNQQRQSTEGTYTKPYTMSQYHVLHIVPIFNT